MTTGYEETLRVLLIEDDREAYLLTKKLLERSRLDVTLDWVSSYGEAVSALGARSYDVYLVDHRLGPADGVELIRHARDNGVSGPIIMLTGEDSEEVEESAMAAGAVDFVPKEGLTSQALTRSIVYALDRSRAEADLRARVRYSTALSEIAQVALGGTSLLEVLENAVETAAEVLEVSHASVVEYLPEDPRLEVRATVGWDSSVLGLRLSPGPGSQAGYTIERGDVVRVPDYASEDRFDVTGFPEEGLVSGMSVVIEGSEGPYGIISVESRQPQRFSPAKAEFLRSLASMLAIAAEERQAREARQRLGEVLRGTPDLVGMADEDGNLLYINPAGRDLLGIGPDQDVSGLTIREMHPERIWDFMEEEVFPQVLETGIWRGETAIKKPDGGEVPLSQVVLAHRGPDGELEFLSTVARDISADREAQERIRFQARLLEAVDEAVIATDRDGLIVFWNRAAEEMYGWSAGEVLGRPVDEVTVPDEGRAYSDEIVSRVFAGESWSGEFQARHRDGRTFPIHVTLSAIRDPAGKVTGLVGVSEDISDRKAAEEDLRRREERFRALIENTSDTITVLDEKLRLRYASRAREEILGVDARAHIGQSIWDIQVVHPDDEPRLRKVFDSVLSEPGETHTATVRLKRDDSVWRVVETKIRNLLHKPAVKGIVVNSRDITDRVELEQQLLQAQKMEAIGRLAGGVAHDFNNILTGILGLTDLVLAEMEDDDPRAEDLREVQRAADRAVGVTSQLLAFGRRQVIQPELLDLPEVLGKMRSMLVPLIGEDVSLQMQSGPGSHKVRLDPGQIEQVVLNLAVNARDAMPEGGSLSMSALSETVEEPREVESGVVDPGHWVVLEVEDDGRGIPADVMEHLFEPFFTTKEVGKGTGLGLSTVYGIVRQAGGHVDVDSEEGLGTTFRLYLPPAEGEVEAAEPTKRTAPVDGGHVILVVEDDEAVRRVTARTLASHGFEVLKASDGQAALALIRDEGVHPDLVVTDAVMPGMRWHELVERLRGIVPGVPVLLVSGYAEDDLRREESDGTVDRFLEKPFTPAQLLENVQEILGGSD